MLKVKYELYVNDYSRKHEEMFFADFSALENWIFDQMQQDYVSNPGAMYFPNKEMIGAKGPSAIEFRPTHDGEIVWIHLIETDAGIVFSDGKFTAGQRHWSSGVKEWLVHCNERKKAPKFNFVDEKTEQESNKIYTHDEAARIVELFESILDANGIVVPSPEDAEKGDDNCACLYGSTYADLLDGVEDILVCMLKSAAAGNGVVSYEFSGTY